MLSCQSKGVLWVEDNITTLRDRQLLNNMPGMCGSWSDKDRMRLGAKLEEVVHHVKVQQMDASVFSEEVEVASDQSFLFSLHSPEARHQENVVCYFSSSQLWPNIWYEVLGPVQTR